MCVFGWNFVEGLCVEIYGFNVWFCWDFVDGLYAEIYGYNVWFVGILLNDFVLKFMGSMCVFGWNVVDGLGVEIYGFNIWFCWNKYGDECEIENRNILILWTMMSQAVQSGLDHRPDKNNPEVEQVGELHLSFYTTRKKYFKLNIIRMR